MNYKNCSCGDDYESAKKKIEEDTKNLKFCYIQGPTGPKGDIGPMGPKGENGPVTIEIGKVETVDPELEAAITNVGTNQEAILNFKIPRGITGMKGEKGDPGERGLPGEIGISQAITVDGTETVESNEEAEVLDDFDNNVHHLTFYIPKGKQGEKGEPNGIGAYGERYSNTNQRFNILANRETIIPLEQTGLAFSINYNSSYAIEIKKMGAYQINYFLNVATSVDTNYAVSVKASGAKILGSDIRGEAKANSISNISGTVISGLVENDEITLVITIDQDADLIFDGTTNAKLSVIKLD